MRCMKEFTREELARHNGKNGSSALVAYEGKVYDVSGSFLWKNGSHQVLHKAGLDLTDAMKQAPHNGDVFRQFPMVGTLRNPNKDNP